MSGTAPSPDHTRHSPHGACAIGGLRIDSYNLALRDARGFLGDRARGERFVTLLEERRAHRRAQGDDPLGDAPGRDRDRLDAALRDERSDAADLVRETIEAFAHEFAQVVERLLAVEPWRGTQLIVVGGGLRDYDVGEAVIYRTNVLLTARGLGVALRPIDGDPDDAGLVGAVRLCPPALLAGHATALTVDIGGTNLRAGLVRLSDSGADIVGGEVLARECWCHGDAHPTREEAVTRLTGLLGVLAARAEREGLALAPFIGVGCPGEIAPDGRIANGGQNLPGDWEEAGFNLAARLRSTLPAIGGQPTHVVLHNDAVVQGLSEVARMRDVERWGVLTIGTGLGNARFTRAAV